MRELTKERKMVLMLKYTPEELDGILCRLIEESVDHHEGDEYNKLCTRVRKTLSTHLKDALKRQNKFYFQEEYDEVMGDLFTQAEFGGQIWRD